MRSSSIIGPMRMQRIRAGCVCNAHAGNRMGDY
jgi:hypothetical protein